MQHFTPQFRRLGLRLFCFRDLFKGGKGKTEGHLPPTGSLGVKPASPSGAHGLHEAACGPTTWANRGAFPGALQGSVK